MIPSLTIDFDVIEAKVDKKMVEVRSPPNLPARIYGIFGGKIIGFDEVRTPLRTHKKAR